MDAADYHRAKSPPDVFAAAELEATVESLRAINSPFVEVVEDTPRVQVPKPPLHGGGAAFVGFNSPAT